MLIPIEKSPKETFIFKETQTSLDICVKLLRIPCVRVYLLSLCLCYFYTPFCHFHSYLKAYSLVCLVEL